MVTSFSKFPPHKLVWALLLMKKSLLLLSPSLCLPMQLTGIFIPPHSLVGDPLAPFLLSSPRDSDKGIHTYILCAKKYCWVSFVLAMLSFLTCSLQFISLFNTPQKLFFCPRNAGRLRVDMPAECKACIVPVDFVVMEFRKGFIGVGFKLWYISYASWKK